MSLSDKDKKKALKIAALERDSDLILLNEIEEAKNELATTIDQKFNTIFESFSKEITNLSQEVKKKLSEELIYEIDPESIRGLPGKDGQSGKDYILTPLDEEKIASRIKIPVIEKVIEKTETIREIPIIRETIKETILESSPQIEAIKEQFDILKKEIKEIDQIAKANQAIPSTTTFFSKNNQVLGRAKNINFIEGASTSLNVNLTGDTANITITSTVIAPTIVINELVSFSGTTGTLAFTPTSTDVLLLRGGVGQQSSVDYTRSNTVITLTVPASPGEIFLATYTH